MLCKLLRNPAQTSLLSTPGTSSTSSSSSTPRLVVTGSLDLGPSQASQLSPQASPKAPLFRPSMLTLLIDQHSRLSVTTSSVVDT
eukprot:3159992-Rhodomonas_salina.1